MARVALPQLLVAVGRRDRTEAAVHRGDPGQHLRERGEQRQSELGPVRVGVGFDPTLLAEVVTALEGLPTTSEAER